MLCQTFRLDQSLDKLLAKFPIEAESRMLESEGDGGGVENLLRRFVSPGCVDTIVKIQWILPSVWMRQFDLLWPFRKFLSFPFRTGFAPCDTTTPLGRPPPRPFAVSSPVDYAWCSGTVQLPAEGAQLNHQLPAKSHRYMNVSD